MEQTLLDTIVKRQRVGSSEERQCTAHRSDLTSHRTHFAATALSSQDVNSDWQCSHAARV